MNESGPSQSEADTPSARLFGRAKALVGMIHVGALPGTPAGGAEVDIGYLSATAAAEARLLADAGFDAIIIENMHDRPYLRRAVGPEIVATMTRIGLEVRDAIADRLVLGVQVLAGANREALAVAQAIEASIIRAEGFVFSSVADEGLFNDADAGELLRYRRTIGAHETVRIICDIKKKHSAHALTSDVPIGDMARAARFFGADGVVVTGTETGRPVAISDLDAVRQATGDGFPLVAGSGVTPENIGDCLAIADAVIVGSWYKLDGAWQSPPDPSRAAAIADAASRAREH